MSVPAPHFDLTSNLELQKQYLLNLTKIPIDARTNTSSDNAIFNLSEKLNSLRSSYDGSNSSSNNVLLSQKKVNDILNSENDRLNLKEQNINDAITGQRRIMYLNMNYQKRYAVYTKMAVTLVIGLVIYFIIRRFEDAFPILPSVIYKLLIIIDFVAVIITIGIFYYELSGRDLMDYDEIVLKAPDLSNSSKENDAAAAAAAVAAVKEAEVKAKLAGSSPVCSGQSCCGTDSSGHVTAYDPKQNICTIEAASNGFGISMFGR
jgi:hypothetical protein